MKLIVAAFWVEDENCDEAIPSCGTSWSGWISTKPRTSIRPTSPSPNEPLWGQSADMARSRY